MSNENIDTDNNDDKLTEQELLNREKGGRYIVYKPLTGFKKIHCECIKTNWFRFTQKYYTTAIAKLEIPHGATIIRYQSPSFYFYSTKFKTDCVSTELRTDKAIVKNIDTAEDLPKYSEEECECYSFHDPDFKYNVGDSIKPTKPLNTNMEEVCASGIHFFFSKKEASEY